MCWPCYNGWLATRDDGERPGASPATVELWRRAAGDESGVYRYIVGLLDTVLGFDPGPDWEPSERAKRWWRRRLGLEAPCYCGMPVTRDGVHLLTDDVRCFPDEPDVPDLGAIPPSARDVPVLELDDEPLPGVRDARENLVQTGV